MLHSPCLKGLLYLLKQNTNVAVWRFWERQDVVKPVKLGVSKQVGSDVAEHCSLTIFLLPETEHGHPQRGTEPSGGVCLQYLETERWERIDCGHRQALLLRRDNNITTS